VATAWHQDFLSQQAPAFEQQNAYGGMSGHIMGGFAGPTLMQTPGFHNAPASQVALGKQRAQEATPAFDEAAFEQAFLQAEAQAEQHTLEAAAEQTRIQTAQDNLEAMGYDRPGELDPLLIRIRETRPGV
jgi:hypothetical protein